METKTNKKCEICGEKIYARGLCAKHYRRALRNRPKSHLDFTACEICGDEKYALGLCRYHYEHKGATLRLHYEIFTENGIIEFRKN